MSEEGEDPMNLDLNLEPAFTTFLTNEADRLLERVRRLEHIQQLEQAFAQRRRWRRRPRLGTAGAPSSQPEPSEPLMEVAVNTTNNNNNPSIERLQIGGGTSVTADVCKSCRGKSANSAAMNSEKDEDLVKGSNNNVLSSSFFDCNICFDLATDPVLTCCGHLFCWPCLYQWINVHSNSKECPVCKGEVTDINVTPIYGRGSNKTRGGDEEKEKEEEVVELKIPPRPHARRIESLRLSPGPMGEPSIRVQEMLLDEDEDDVSVEGEDSLTLQELRQRNNGIAVFQAARDSEGFVRMTHQSELNSLLEMGRLREGDPNQDEVDGNRSRRRTLSRAQRSRTAYLISLLNSGDGHGVFETYNQGQSASINNQGQSASINNQGQSLSMNNQGHSVSINQNQTPSTDDRDSFSSIAAVINSGSQTVDTVIEIDSDVSLTSPSSLRRTRNTLNLPEMNRDLPRSSRRRR